jgi:hypothetical protein
VEVITEQEVLPESPRSLRADKYGTAIGAAGFFHCLSPNSFSMFIIRFLAAATTIFVLHSFSFRLYPNQ